MFDFLLKSVGLIGAVGAAISFLWGVYQFLLNQRIQAEARRLDATKPFLNRQLELYVLATKATAAIATSTSDPEIEKAKAQFWALYWGELGMVEDVRVEGAMRRFGDALKASASNDTLQTLSLDLARACRNSLAASWNVREWENPWTAVTKRSRRAKAAELWARRRFRRPHSSPS